MLENAAGVIGVELLGAAQGIDFHRPSRSSRSLELAHAAVRSEVAFYDADRYFAPDIEAAKRLVKGGHFTSFTTGLLPSEAA
jgi:histidine ammonia-lyase